MTRTPPNMLLACLLSLVVEHSLCKRKVGGSIPPVGFLFLQTMGERPGLKKKEEMRQPGVEPGAKAWEASMLPIHHWRILQ